MARQPDAHKQTDAVDVAVVIAAYQAEPFLAECVASVLAQSLESFHLVIVDDGSTDGTLRIARGRRSGVGRIDADRHTSRGARPWRRRSDRRLHDRS